MRVPSDEEARLTFEEPGECPITCDVHESMESQLRVVGADLVEPGA